MALRGGMRAVALAAMLLLAVTVGLIVPAICSGLLHVVHVVLA